MQKPMTEEELREITGGIVECFSSTIALTPVERADYLSRIAVRLSTEVQRRIDEDREAGEARRNASPGHGAPHRAPRRLSEELSGAISEELSDAIGGYYRPG